LLRAIDHSDLWNNWPRAGFNREALFQVFWDSTGGCYLLQVFDGSQY
jgi:hypothetical protein